MKTPSQFDRYKKFKYLFLSGPFIFTIGAIAGIVSGIWSLIPLSLIITGTIFTFIWLGLTNSPLATRVRTNVLISSLAVLIILGLINFLASRYNFRIDLTENQIYTLSPQTQQVIKNLNKPLTVWVFDRDFSQGDRELLAKYSRYSPKFKYELVDPQVEADKLAAFQAGDRVKIDSAGQVYLEYLDKKQLVQQLYGQNPLSKAAKVPISEVELTNAIAAIQRDRIPYVYFLTGHGEIPLKDEAKGFSRAVSSLEGKGYKIENLNLVTAQKIPANTSAIVLANPQKELFPAEIKLLQEYLNNGGRLLLMLDPEVSKVPKSILQTWGIKLDDRIIIDASGSNLFLNFGVDTTVVTEYGDSPVTKDFSDKNITIFYRARAIEIESKKDISAAALLITDKNTWAESELSERVSLDPEKDKEGPLNIAYSLTKKDSEARLVVFGDADFATNNLFPQQFNGNLFLNAIEWLANSDDATISISPKEPQNRRLNISPDRARVIISLAIFIVPILGFIIGGITWWRRR